LPPETESSASGAANQQARKRANAPLRRRGALDVLDPDEVAPVIALAQLDPQRPRQRHQRRAQGRQPGPGDELAPAPLAQREERDRRARQRQRHEALGEKAQAGAGAAGREPGGAAAARLR
jgi:hypothetical protein